MRGVLIILFSMCVAVCFGQLRHDANWVFGHNAGIHFTDTATIAETYFCKNHEIASSYSYVNQLYYLSNDTLNDDFGMLDIRDKNDSIIINGGNLYTYSSSTNGATFLPSPGNATETYIIHSGSPINCGGGCNNLYYTIIENSDTETSSVTVKNIPLGIKLADERIMPVRHGNGEDWWIFSHKKGDTASNGCNNTFFTLLLNKDGVTKLDSQDVGPNFCFPYSIAGEHSISQEGNFLAIAALEDNFVNIYNIDRCTGLLNQFTTLLMPYTSPYGVCFSPNERYLYVTSEDTLYQFDLQATGGIINSKVILDSNLPTGGQLQLGPDGRIYMAQVFKPYLGVINSPDSAGLACNYVYNGLALAQGTYSVYGLPNMPNYNLGPLPIYQASAGVDTFYCQGDSTIKALPIGGDSLPNITYLWQPAPGIDSLTARTQLVLPAQSRWYYVTITDTSYFGPSCNSRLDSVYVEVRTCTGITETATLQAKLYPNPTNGMLTVEVPQGAGGYTFRLFNLLGQQVLEYPLERDKTTFPLDFAKGIYLYQITAHNGLVQFGKLVVE